MKSSNSISLLQIMLMNVLILSSFFSDQESSWMIFSPAWKIRRLLGSGRKSTDCLISTDFISHQGRDMGKYNCIFFSEAVINTRVGVSFYGKRSLLRVLLCCLKENVDTSPYILFSFFFFSSP